MGHNMEGGVVFFENLEYLRCNLDAILKFEAVLLNGLH